jgi:hypothetical protein
MPSIPLGKPSGFQKVDAYYHNTLAPANVSQLQLRIALLAVIVMHGGVDDRHCKLFSCHFL